jgi:hypothetical protein
MGVCGLVPSPPSSLRAKRSNPPIRLLQHGLLRRFAPRNDDEAQSRILAARNVRVLCQLYPRENQRAQGKPDAGRTRSPVCELESIESTRVNYRYAETFRPSLRDGVRFMARSPRSAGLVSLRRLRSSASLIPASGDRDHTLLPSAGRIPRQMMQLRVHRTPPDVRDDAYAPPIGAG